MQLLSNKGIFDREFRSQSYKPLFFSFFQEPFLNSSIILGIIQFFSLFVLFLVLFSFCSFPYIGSFPPSSSISNYLETLGLFFLLVLFFIQILSYFSLVPITFLLHPILPIPVLISFCILKQNIYPWLGLEFPTYIVLEK